MKQSKSKLSDNTLTKEDEKQMESIDPPPLEFTKPQNVSGFLGGAVTERTLSVV